MKTLYRICKANDFLFNVLVWSLGDAQGRQPATALGPAALDVSLIVARNPSPCTFPSQTAISGQPTGRAHLSPT